MQFLGTTAGLCCAVSGKLYRKTFPRSIPTEKILYIDVQGHTTVIHTEMECISLAVSFGKLTTSLEADERFLPCIRGILVNMQHIQEMDGNLFRLSNGETLPINIRNKKTIGDSGVPISTTKWQRRIDALMNTSKSFRQICYAFPFSMLTCLGSSIPVSAEAEEEPEVLTAIASADVFLQRLSHCRRGILSNWKNLSTVWKNRFPI